MDKVYIANSCIISSLGVSTHSNVDAILAHTTNISQCGNTPVCKINSNLLNLKELSQFTFAEQLCITALENVANASSVSISGSRTSVIFSTTKGNIDKINSDFERAQLWSLAQRVSSYFGMEQTPIIVSTACISGVAAIALASRMIEDDDADHVFVVGVDVIGNFIVEGFNSFKSISPTVCRPYDESRDGLTAGEGCGVLLLTNDISKSDTKISIAGCGLASDANHISGPSRTGDGLHFAIERAMHEANITAADVDYINLHGTGTPFNDEMESKAINTAQLLHAPVNSLKQCFGHTFGASGIIETILIAEQMAQNTVFGVKGYEKCGVPFSLNVSPNHRPTNINCAIKTASGFGGTNAAIVLSKNNVSTRVKTDAKTTELAHIHINSNSIKQPFSEYIKAEYKALNDANIKFFKMDALSKLGYVASCKLMNLVNLELPSNRIAILLANRSSSLQTDLKHQEIIEQNLPEGASPAVFVYTLANIVAAEISIKHKFQGEQLFLIYEHKCMDKLQKRAQEMIQRDICDAVLYGWCEYLDQNYDVELKLIKKICNED